MESAPNDAFRVNHKGRWTVIIVGHYTILYKLQWHFFKLCNQACWSSRGFTTISMFTIFSYPGQSCSGSRIYFGKTGPRAGWDTGQVHTYSNLGANLMWKIFLGGMQNSSYLTTNYLRVKPHVFMQKLVVASKNDKYACCFNFHKLRGRPRLGSQSLEADCECSHSKSYHHFEWKCK